MMKQYCVEIGRVTKAATHTGVLDNRIVSSSIITLKPVYVRGMDGLEPGMFLDVLYLFHKSDAVKMCDTILGGEEKGIFATRSPHRPSRIGLTRVMLVSREGYTLEVTGLDAWEGSPVIDIKPSDRIADTL